MFFFIRSCVLLDITTVQKKGANHGNISLYLAPESDEWEEIECDEANAKPVDNHPCLPPSTTWQNPYL